MNHPQTSTPPAVIHRLTVLARVLSLLALALVLSSGPLAAQTAPLRRVNAPYFDNDVRLGETAIFWFGRISPTSNYADARIGYSPTELYIRVSAADRRLWMDHSPNTAVLTQNDAVSVFLHTGAPGGATLSPAGYRFIVQFDRNDTLGKYTAAYQGSPNGWTLGSLPFTYVTNWRGNDTNDDIDDRGWLAILHIPWTTLGLSGPPAPGTTWGLGLRLHDRDDAARTSIPDQVWPEAMQPDQPATWGQLGFGLPGYTRPSVSSPTTTTIRQGVNGASVPDAAVGGHTTCGDNIEGQNLDYWTQWGNKNYAGYQQFNIQNQEDIADWPCFSKYYVSFPLDQVPAGKAIVSATLTLRQFGNAGPGWGTPYPSLVQVMSVGEAWDVNTITWNNAPYARENVSQAWVDPIDGCQWPCVARSWDVSRAVAEARAAGNMVRLALYSADGPYHSGKYFTSSDQEAWNVEGRPMLQVVWGDPVGSAPSPTAVPSATAPPAPTATSGPPTGANWYGSGWGYRKKLTVDRTRLSGTSILQDFPVLVSLSDPNLRDSAQDDGDDLLFTAADGLTKLDHEIERFDKASGTLVAWVRLPSLNPAVSTDLYLYYGHPSAPSQQNAPSVWNPTYKLVQHLHQSPSASAPQFRDATLNHNDATALGAMTAANSVPAKIGFGLLLDGLDDLLTLNTETGLAFQSASAFTYQAWLKTDDTATRSIVLGDYNNRPAINLEIAQSTGQLRPYVGDASGVAKKDYVCTTNVANNVWHLVAMTYDGATQSLKAFVDGVEDSCSRSADNALSGSLNNPETLKLGADGRRAYFLEDLLDEVRVSAAARSADWLRTEFTNQSNPAAFFTLGPQESLY